MKTKINIQPVDFNTTVEFYKKYLSTPRKDWQENVRRPLQPKVYDAMCATHDKIGADPIPLINRVKEAGGRVFYWSDLHFFHANIITHAERPFESAAHMNQVMQDNYRAAVTDKDLVIFCGDIAFYNMDPVKEILRSLPGKKVLVMGNHDFDKNKLTFKDYGVFDIQTMAFGFDFQHGNTTYRVVVSHYPVATDVLPENTINIHGHIHQHSAEPRHVNVSVEHTGYAPVEIESRLIECIQSSNG